MKNSFSFNPAHVHSTETIYQLPKSKNMHLPALQNQHGVCFSTEEEKQIFYSTFF